MRRNIYSTDGRGAVDFDPYPLQAPAPQRATTPLFYDCVWINGELVPAEDAHVGDEPAICEEIRCYDTERGPAIFRLENHLQRFLKAAHTMDAGDLRYNMLELRRAVHVTAYVNNLSSGTVRPIVYADRRRAAGSYPTVAVVAATQAAPDAASVARDGVRLQTVPVQQKSPGNVLSRQTLQQRTARATQARLAARRAQFDEAVLLGPNGMVIDCTGGNLFLVHDGVVHTSPADGDNDVARDTAITLLYDMGYDVVAQPTSRKLLLRAEELFLWRAGGELLTVAQLDDRPFDQASSVTVTSRLQQLFAATTRGRARRSRGWLEYVMMEPLF